MGGQAFAHLRLDVPRMPQEVYDKMVKETLPLLGRIFKRCTIPHEAPGKTNYGDIDFLVEGIIPASPPSNETVWQRVESVLNAKHHVAHNSHSFAIEHPDIPNAYVQVDVELCPGNDTESSDELFKWTVFMKSYADLLQIIGISHRDLGLVCTDHGLHVRIEKIEPYNKKKSRLFLTRDPGAAMEFYGLDPEKYRNGFQTEEEMFDWVSSGRLFSREIFESRSEKANDRARQAKRSMYRRFVEEYMPSHPERGGAQVPATRLKVLMEAVTAFDKISELQATIREHEERENEMDLWDEIRRSLPIQGSALGLVLKALKRWVSFKDGEPYIATDPMLDTTPLWITYIDGETRALVIAWVLSNWKTVKALEKGRVEKSKTAARGKKINVTDSLSG